MTIRYADKDNRAVIHPQWGYVRVNSQTYIAHIAPLVDSGEVSIEPYTDPLLLPEILSQRHRQLRDSLLKETDITVLRHLEKGEAVPQPIKDYRQELRDVPQQEGYPESVNWPILEEG